VTTGGKEVQRMLADLPGMIEAGSSKGLDAVKPCIRAMRVTVRRVLEILATPTDRVALLAEYPFLEREDLQQALCYTAAEGSKPTYRY
jgi:uncharacterized protein (DUF433 family)